MMRVSRRAVMAGGLTGGLAGGLAGALASAPSAGMAQGWPQATPAVFLYDPALPLGRRLAGASQAWKRRTAAIEGDRIRFARAIFAQRPALVTGLSRQGDLVLIAEVAREAGYRRIRREAAGRALEWSFAPAV